MTLHDFEGGGVVFGKNVPLPEPLGVKYEDKPSDIGFNFDGYGSIRRSRKGNLVAKDKTKNVEYISSEPLELNEYYSINFEDFSDGTLVWVRRQDGSLVEWNNTANKDCVWLSKENNDETIV